MKGGERRRKEGGDQRCNNTSDALIQQLTVALKGEAGKDGKTKIYHRCMLFFPVEKMCGKMSNKHHEKSVHYIPMGYFINTKGHQAKYITSRN